MSLTQILFWVLSVLSVVSAINVVISKNPIFSVLWLIVTFFCISGHYILLNAQFLAVVNIIVYAGAIMVLFLFVIMLMNLDKKAEVVSISSIAALSRPPKLAFLLVLLSRLFACVSLSQTFPVLFFQFIALQLFQKLTSFLNLLLVS